MSPAIFDSPKAFLTKDFLVTKYETPDSRNFLRISTVSFPFNP
jgi:hypothetical protein